MKFKIFPFFLVLMICGGGLYMLTIIPISNFTLLNRIDSIPREHFKRNPTPVQLNFTYRLSGVRVNVPNPKSKSLLQLFRVALNSDERNLFYFTMATFTNTLYKANVTFMLYGGSLVGSRRHHGFIPWDDDIDVWINATEKNRVKGLLASVKSFALYSPVNFQWKFFYKNLKTLKNLKFRWPYIDIFFFRENATHIWEEQKVHRHKYYKRSSIFPLIFRPFDVFRLPTPCAVEEFVGKYNLEYCQTTNFIHRTETYLPRLYKRVVPCKMLYPDYPFVFKFPLNKTFSLEQLHHGDDIICQYRMPTDACNVEYSIE